MSSTVGLLHLNSETCRVQLYISVLEIDIKIAFAKIDLHPDFLDRRSGKFGVDVEIAKIAMAISIFDLLPARVTPPHYTWKPSFLPRSNNAQSVVGCCVCKFRCYITEHCRVVCIITAMCNLQYRALCCVVAGTTAALLSVLLFSSEVSVVKYAACMPGYPEAVILVWGIPCLLQQLWVCESSTRRDASTDDACPKPEGTMIWKWKMETNSDLCNRRTTLSMLLLLLFTANILLHTCCCRQ